MDIKQIIRSTKVGHYNKLFTVTIAGGLLITIGLIILYYANSQINTSQLNNRIVSNNIDDSSDIPVNAISKINQRAGGLWVENYIYINGKKYQLKYDKNGKLGVLKNNAFMDLSKAVGNQSAIVHILTHKYYLFSKYYY